MATEDPTRLSVHSAMTANLTLANLSAVELETLRRCAEDVCSVRGGFQTDFASPAHLIAARRLRAAGLVDWIMPREGFAGGYSTSDAGRALLDAAKGGA